MQAAVRASLNQYVLKVRFVLELYAGSCRWSRAAGRAGNVVISIDLRFDATSHNLGAKKLQDAICGWIQAGWVTYWLAGFPCQSFSVARGQPNGPPALRSAEHVEGLPTLSGHDLVKVQWGNAALAFVSKLLRLSLRMRVVGVAENPWRSWAWQQPVALRLRQRADVRFARADFCQFGTSWQKATGFMTVHADVGHIDRVCQCRSGLCIRSGRPHLRLQGKSPEGVFWTTLAEAYPASLCRSLV